MVENPIKAFRRENDLTNILLVFGTDFQMDESRISQYANFNLPLTDRAARILAKTLETSADHFQKQYFLSALDELLQIGGAETKTLKVLRQVLDDPAIPAEVRSSLGNTIIRYYKHMRRQYK